MRISFVMQHADMSGGTRAVAEFGRQLQLRGHQVTVYSIPRPTPTLTGTIKAALRGRRIRPPVENSHLDNSGLNHQIVPAIDDTHIADADAVLATWWRTAQWVSNLSHSKGTKFNFLQHYETWGGPPAEVDAVWRLPLHKIVVARWLADLARDRFHDSTVQLVSYGLDHNQFHAPPRGKQSIATVGMLHSHTPFKGVEVGLKAIDLARQTYGPIQLRAFGAVPREGLPKEAEYWQNPPQDHIKDFYAACDLFLCSSHTEGFFMPALEAMACRCPVVSTRVGWPMEGITDGINGHLAAPGDVNALAAGIVKTLKLSDSDWRQMSEAAYATSGRYSWQDAGAKMEAALQNRIERIS